MQNSKFLQFVSKMSRGELIIDDNQVKEPTLSASGDWAAEYQQQYKRSPAWADESVCYFSTIDFFNAVSFFRIALMFMFMHVHMYVYTQLLRFEILYNILSKTIRV